MRLGFPFFTFFSTTPKIPFSRSSSGVSFWQFKTSVHQSLTKVLPANNCICFQTVHFLETLKSSTHKGMDLLVIELQSQRWNSQGGRYFYRQEKNTMKIIRAWMGYIFGNIFAIFQWRVVNSSGSWCLLSDIPGQDKNLSKSERKCLLWKKEKWNQL